MSSIFINEGPHNEMPLKILCIIFPRMQCARSMRVRKSRPVSQFCHTLFTTDIVSYIEVTLIQTHTKKKSLRNTPLFLPHCYLLAALRCTAVQPSKGNCLEKPVTLRQKNWSSSCSTCRHSQPLPSVLSTAFMCMVMLRAYCWLSLLPIPPFISCSLVKGIIMHWPLCCLLSRLLY